MKPSLSRRFIALLLSVLIVMFIISTVPANAAPPRNSCFEYIQGLNSWVNYGTFKFSDCLSYLYQSSTLYGTGYSFGQWGNTSLLVYTSTEVYAKPVNGNKQWQLIGYFTPPVQPTPTPIPYYPPISSDPGDDIDTCNLELIAELEEELATLQEIGDMTGASQIAGLLARARADCY